ncbi:uncharacterized protein LOC119838111 isoform X1 [Zerene cesonia]|uniref:uncharacterized protein LOC119838111 isoform X1 n=1 Tax=Zerene cesonia TaxID=33412 RepID=UPI0018E57273|nr:uncharacterized protein LOC119838111 isoform X1 [Zerene cesonia]XP_038219854.1 uncharacterized protein LOC119838111 isoform X1 [Zerene cesonia]
MKPLLQTVVVICLLIGAQAHPENIEDVKELPQTKEPVVEAEESEPVIREERCSTCGPLKIKSPKEVLAALQALPGSEVHTQQSFEGCSSDKGCAGIKVKDGQVIQRYGNTDAFKAAEAADINNEFNFLAAGALSNPFWWMNENSPFKTGGSYEKFSKASSSYTTGGAAGNAGLDGPLNLAGNPFLNGDFANAAFAGQGVAKPGSSFQSSSFESSYSSKGDLDLSKNPFFNGGFKAQGGLGQNAFAQGAGSNFGGANFASQGGLASFGAQGASGFGAQGASNGFAGQSGSSYGSQSGSSYGSQSGSSSFGSQSGLSNFGSQSGSSYGAQGSFGLNGAGYTASSPRPFAGTTGVNVIQNTQKASEFDFDQQQQTQQNIDELFQGSGNVQETGDFQQTCAGQGYICVPKAQCNNGVVNSNGANLLQARTKKQYCNLRTEICCRLEVASINQGNLGSSFGQGSIFGQSSNAFGSTASVDRVASAFVPVTPVTPIIPDVTSQNNFIETDSFSAGSENNGIYRPGSIGSGLKPGIPYLPPVDNINSGTNLVSTTAFTPAIVSTPRPIIPTVKPYIPPVVTSTSAPGYLPPIGEQTINRETIVPNPVYNEGSIILDETRNPRPKPTPAVPFVPNEIPAGCAAALKCTPVEFCTAEGVISNTSVILTRDQDAYRVPLTDCRDLETGRIGKCCRDPYYTDPWPTNQLGKWVPGVFGGNDGKYVPDSRGSSNNIRPVTPPTTGSVILGNFMTTPKPTVPSFGSSPVSRFPTTVTPFVPKISGQGQFTKGGQGQFTKGGQGQYGLGGRGQVGQVGIGQIGTGGRGQFSQVGRGQVGIGGQGQFAQGGRGQIGVGSQGQYGRGQVGVVGQGEATQVGVGQIGVVGQGQYGQVGRGQAGVVGQGVNTQFGAGQIGVGGQGQYSQVGRGQVGIAGQGQATQLGVGQVGLGGQGQYSQVGRGQVGIAGQGQTNQFGIGQVGQVGVGGQGQYSQVGRGQVGIAGQGQTNQYGVGQVGVGGQGQYSQVGRGQVGVVGQGAGQIGGQGQYAQVGRGQIGVAGQGVATQLGNGQIGVVDQGEYTQLGNGQIAVNGRGQYAQVGRGQIAVGGAGQLGSGSQVNNAFAKGQFGQGGIATQGQGELVSQGQGQLVSQGQGQLVSQGQGQLVSQGQGQLVNQGTGQYVSQGKGQYSFGSSGQYELGGQGQQQGFGIISQAQGLSKASGQLVSQAQGQSVSQGKGQIVSQGKGQIVSQGKGQIVTQGQGTLVTQGGGSYIEQGEGQTVSQGFGTGIRQGQGFSVSQGSGFGVENEYQESVQRVFLQRYNGAGQCGILNPQKPYGNKNDLEVDFAEIPWQAMVLLQTNRSLLCGGVITRPDVVVTSAACVEGLDAKNVLIKGGEWKLGIDDEPLPFQIVQVKTILRHPFYRRGSLLYDAAILVLSENLRLAKNINPICLPSTQDTLDAFYNGAGECIVTGWGKIVLQAHLEGAIMHSMNVSLINPGECQAKLSSDYPHLLEQYSEDSCVCGQPTNPLNNICKVDIGSALACTSGDGRYVMRGVYSWDSGCQVGNQIASFYKFDLEWYEWAIGLIESVRFSQFTKVTTGKYTGQINGGIKGSQFGGGVKTNQFGGAVKTSQFGKAQFGSGGSTQFGGVTGSLNKGSAISTGSQGVGFTGVKAFAVSGKGQFGFEQGSGLAGQNEGLANGQFGTGQLSQFASGKFGTGQVGFESADFNGQIKSPITSNAYSATYSEKKVFQTEPKIISFTTKPEIVTFTTKPEIFTYTTKPKIITYTTKPKIITYTTKPKIITYTTKPQIITYETSGSGTNPQYVAPGVTFNPSFSELVGAHSHTSTCKCLENK